MLLHHFKHNKVLHQQVVILSITTDAIPEVPDADKVRIKSFGQGFWGVTAHYGFKESPGRARHPPELQGQASQSTKPTPASIWAARRCARSKGAGMAEWRKLLFRFLSRNSRSATDFFALPPNRVVEIGAQIRASDPELLTSLGYAAEVTMAARQGATPPAWLGPLAPRACWAMSLGGLRSEPGQAGSAGGAAWWPTSARRWCGGDSSGCARSATSTAFPPAGPAPGRRPRSNDGGRGRGDQDLLSV